MYYDLSPHWCLCAVDQLFSCGDGTWELGCTCDSVVSQRGKSDTQSFWRDRSDSSHPMFIPCLPRDAHIQGTAGSPFAAFFSIWAYTATNPGHFSSPFSMYLHLVALNSDLFMIVAWFHNSPRELLVMSFIFELSILATEHRHDNCRRTYQ